MKQYHFNSTYFLQNQIQDLTYQTHLFAENVNLEWRLQDFESKINNTYYDRPCTILSNITDCEFVGERSLEFGFLTLKKRMQSYSYNYIQHLPIIEASNNEIYTFDFAVNYSTEILMNVLINWKNTMDNLAFTQFMISIG